MDKYQELIYSRIVSGLIWGPSFLLKVIKVILTIFWIGISLGIIYFYWSGMMPESIRGTSSSRGIEISVKITGTHGWRPAYETTLTLTASPEESFVYYLDTLGSQAAVEKLIGSMGWENGNIFSFENHLKNKKVIIAYTNGLWTLAELPVIADP